MTQIQIIAKNPLWNSRDRYKVHVPETHTYVGEQLSAKGADPVCLSVADEGEFTERKIARKDVLSCKQYRESDPVEVEPERHTWIVDDDIWVIRDNGNWSCSCWGFYFHEKCRHVREYKAKWKDENHG
tara:strand:- start:611 stop:994 length:384 start_codon:yes stop_codon:yes gene_type:complete